MQTDTSILKLDINQIIPNKYQPRKVFDEKALTSLSESIKTYGIINPILVRKKDDKYEIIAGERRFRAAQKIGLKEVPVIIKNANEQEMAELALIENLERQELTAIEEAKSYEEIMRIGNQTQASLASKLGKSQSSIANKIRLLSLPIEIQDALSHKKISERHARSLINVNDKDKQLELLQRIITEKLTVKETEQIINEKEITETEIKQAINDIMKSLNISEEKEEKEDDNMNNGNFFPNFDNNTNNNASLNMMNMQSMTQQAMEPAQEMVMPTITQPVQEQQLIIPNQPMEFPQTGINSEASMMSQNPMGVPSFNNINPMDNVMNPQESIISPQPVMNNPIPNDNSFFGPTVMPTLEPINNQMSSSMIDAPLFNPEVVMPTQVNEVPPMASYAQEPQMITPNPFEVPVMPIETPVSMPSQNIDRLTELQNLLNNNGYAYKVYSNDTDNCVIIELPKN